jgi:energy-coupling factor transport system ATP-binding protein
MKGGEILHTWTQDEFLALTGAQREKLGLRAVHLDTLCAACPERTVPAPAFAVNNLTAGYKRAKPVLKNVSFAAAPGEVIGIVGKNGQGKSTLARTLCGLHRESDGSVMLDDRTMRPRSRAGPVYLVMQESGYQLFTDSVENELRLSKSKRDRPPDAKVDAILDSLNLTKLRGRHPMSLSGGEKQRTAIGAAMAVGAQILILDEPTSGLDFANMRRVAQVLNNLAENGKTIFVITHDFELLARACTRILMVDDGKITGDDSLSTKNLLRTKEILK